MFVSTDTWIQAQQSVLGSCLIDDRCVSKIVFGLTEQDFAEAYRTMYRAMRDMYTTGKAVDPVTVLAAIGRQYKDTILCFTPLNESRYTRSSRIAWSRRTTSL